MSMPFSREIVLAVSSTFALNDNCSCDIGSDVREGVLLNIDGGTMGLARIFTTLRKPAWRFGSPIAALIRSSVCDDSSASKAATWVASSFVMQ